MSNILNIQAQIQTLSRALIDAEKVMDAKHLVYSRFADAEEVSDSELSDEGKAALQEYETAEREYDEIDSKLMDLQDELDGMIERDHAYDDDD